MIGALLAVCVAADYAGKKRQGLMVFVDSQDWEHRDRVMESWEVTTLYFILLIIAFLGSNNIT